MENEKWIPESFTITSMKKQGIPWCSRALPSGGPNGTNNWSRFYSNHRSNTSQLFSCSTKQHIVSSPVNPGNVRKPNLSRILLFLVFLFYFQYYFVVFNVVTSVLHMWWLSRILKISSMAWKPNNIQWSLFRVKRCIQVWERHRYKPPETHALYFGFSN